MSFVESRALTVEDPEWAFFGEYNIAPARTITPDYFKPGWEVNLTPAEFLQRWNQNVRVWAADEKGGLRETTRNAALSKQFIQVNAKSRVNLIVVDVDNPYTFDVVEELVASSKLPMYSGMVLNPESGHGHVFWFLAGELDSRNPGGMGLVSAVQACFTTLIPGGDPGYTMYSMRNPARKSSMTAWGTAHRYNLSELMAYVEAKPAPAKPPQTFTRSRGKKVEVELDPNSTTRNQDLWFAVKEGVYGEYARADYDEYVRWYASQRNAEFAKPLNQPEVDVITRSILRFVRGNFRKPSGGYRAHQVKASNSRPIVKAALSKDQRVLEIIERGGGRHEVAEAFSIKVGTADVWIIRARERSAKRTAAA